MTMFGPLHTNPQILKVEQEDHERIIGVHILKCEEIWLSNVGACPDSWARGMYLGNLLDGAPRAHAP